MAEDRKRTVRLGFLNVVTHPHSPDDYVSLFQRAFRARVSTKIRADRHAMIQELHQDPTSKALKGRFATFTNIDASSAWLSVRRLDSADEQELNQIQIPEDLKPNFRSVSFLFSPAKHLLALDIGEMSPGSARAMVSGLLSQALIENQTLAVTVVQDRQKLERIWASKIHQLTIVIKQPNANIDARFERNLAARMKRMHVDEAILELKGDRETPIQPDATTRETAELALANGHVKSVSTIDGKRQKLDTTESPFIAVQEVRAVSRIEALWAAGAKVIQNWRNRL